MEDVALDSAGDPEFYGEVRHALDPKGRLILPADHRPHFAGGAYLDTVLDGCLALRTPAAFSLKKERMLQLARQGAKQRQVFRFWSANTQKVVPDKQGRIAIATHLRDYARLGRDVVILGMVDHIELWDPQRWDEVRAQGNQTLFSGEEGLDDLGY